MANAADDPDAVVGVRFERRGPVAWYRAGDVPAAVRSWVVADAAGGATVGQVVVGRGQCLGFPGDPRSLPILLRAAQPEEIPPPPEGGGKRLLDSLPLGPAADAN